MRSTETIVHRKRLFSDWRCGCGWRVSEFIYAYTSIMSAYKYKIFRRMLVTKQFWLLISIVQTNKNKNIYLNIFFYVPLNNHNKSHIGLEWYECE